MIDRVGICQSAKVQAPAIKKSDAHDLIKTCFLKDLRNAPAREADHGRSLYLRHGPNVAGLPGPAGSNQARLLVEIQ
jgi:hypothetical protein